MNGNFPRCFDHIDKINLGVVDVRARSSREPSCQVRTSALVNAFNLAPKSRRYTSLVMSGCSAVLGNDFNTKCFERIGSAFFSSREPMASINVLTAFSWGVVASMLAIWDVGVCVGGVIVSGIVGE